MQKDVQKYEDALGTEWEYTRFVVYKTTSNLREKYLKSDKEIWSCFIGLEKVFDDISS